MIFGKFGTLADISGVKMGEERFRAQERSVRQVAAQQGRCYYYRPLFRLSNQGLGVSAGSNGGLEGAEQLKTK